MSIAASSGDVLSIGESLGQSAPSDIEGASWMHLAGESACLDHWASDWPTTRPSCPVTLMLCGILGAYLRLPARETDGSS